MINVEFEERDPLAKDPLEERIQYKRESVVLNYLVHNGSASDHKQARSLFFGLVIALLVLSGVIVTTLGNGSRLEPSELMSKVRSNE